MQSLEGGSPDRLSPFSPLPALQHAQAIIPPARFPVKRDIPVAETDASFAEMQRIERALPVFRDRPVLLAWGMRDPVLPEPVLRMWQALYPHAETLQIEEASHFLQEDAPGPVLERVEAFLAAHA